MKRAAAAGGQGSWLLSWMGGGNRSDRGSTRFPESLEYQVGAR